MSKYDEFVPHPRYGRGPRVTGSNPQTNYEEGVHLHWHSPTECRVPHTAVVANLFRQTPATFPITHYFDVERQCRECGQSFIFFALEQKYWYEELEFPLESDCVRCISCRKQQQGIARTREQYEALSRVADRTAEQDLILVECYVSLHEESMSQPRQIPRMRGILKRFGPEATSVVAKQVDSLRRRLQHLESPAVEHSAALDVQTATRTGRK